MKILLALLFMASAAGAQQRSMVLASTTSTQNSGLLDVILPQFEASTGIHVFVVAVGTGQALRIAQNGDADAILVHHRASEDQFVADGFGIDRLDIMFNDFVIIGPKSDPAGISEALSAGQAFANISSSQSRFVSRGDNSGTHLRELEIWREAGLSPEYDGYLEVGSGMGTALNLASGLGAYILADRGTWLSFQNRGDLALLFEGGAEMINPYGYVRVDPARFAHIKSAEAEALGLWLTSSAGQAAIAGFRIMGVQLFCASGLAPPDQQNDQQGTCAAGALQR